MHPARIQIIFIDTYFSFVHRSRYAWLSDLQLNEGIFNLPVCILFGWFGLSLFIYLLIYLTQWEFTVRISRKNADSGTVYSAYIWQHGGREKTILPKWTIALYIILETTASCRKNKFSVYDRWHTMLAFVSTNWCQRLSKSTALYWPRRPVKKRFVRNRSCSYGKLCLALLRIIPYIAQEIVKYW